MSKSAWSLTLAVGLMPFAFSQASENESRTLSIDALRSCAAADVAECQFQYAAALEAGNGLTKDLAAAKHYYERAYSNGYEAAGPALLRLTRATSVAPHPDAPHVQDQMPFVQNPAAPAANTNSTMPTATINESSKPQTPIPITSTRRNPGKLVVIAPVSDAEVSQYTSCWRITFTRAFLPPPRKLRRSHIVENRDSDFEPLVTPEIRTICKKDEKGIVFLLDAGKILPLRVLKGANNRTHFVEEFQTAKDQTTHVSITIGPKQWAEFSLHVYPLGKDARVSRLEPISHKWFRGTWEMVSP